jgi:hypothetical protein
VDQEEEEEVVVVAHQHLWAASAASAASAEVEVGLCPEALEAEVEVHRCLAWAVAGGLIFRALVVEAGPRR